MTPPPPCVFCEIVEGKAPATYVEIGDRHVAIEPRRPHAPGHVLFIPRVHVRDATTAPGVTGYTVAAASAYVHSLGRPANVITSVGARATQSVMHLHVHVVPRGDGDGLRLSWPWRVRHGESLGPGEQAPPGVL